MLLTELKKLPLHDFKTETNTYPLDELNDLNRLLKSDLDRKMRHHSSTQYQSELRDIGCFVPVYLGSMQNLPQPSDLVEKLNYIKQIIAEKMSDLNVPKKAELSSGGMFRPKVVHFPATSPDTITNSPSPVPVSAPISR